MDFETYHDQTESTAMYPHVATGDIMALMYTALGLAGEAGEIANQVKKILRDDDAAVTAARRTAIGKELGDVFWYLSRFMHEMGIDHRAVLGTNVEKLQARKQQGNIFGDGDNRESPSGAGVHVSLPAYPQRRWGTAVVEPEHLTEGEFADGNFPFNVMFQPERGVHAGNTINRTLWAHDETELRARIFANFGPATLVFSVNGSEENK